MNLKSIKDFSNDDMSVEIEDAVVIFKLKTDIFNLMTDLNKAERYIELMSAIELNPEIKVVLSILEADATGLICSTYINNKKQRIKPLIGQIHKIHV